MERDAPAQPFSPGAPPPPPPAVVYRVGLVGLSLVGLAALAGYGLDVNGRGGPGPASTLRLVAVAAGLLTAGAALSMRAGLTGAWAVAAAALVLSRVGLPGHWDSARMAAGVAAAAAAGGMVLAAAPRGPRLALASLFMAYHFMGIFCSTTWPSPTPWVTEQVGTRVHLPYLMFMYLRNAYHFYSPEPGPASHLFCLVKFELDETATDPGTGLARLNPDGSPAKKTEYEWVKLPDRVEHMKDPMGLQYYRRLAITEGVSQTVSDAVTAASFEKLDVRIRRYKVATGDFAGYAKIPLAPDDIEQPINQYRLPYPEITRYLLPSYAKHLLTSNSSPGRVAKVVKIYRLEHRIVGVAAFKNGLSPFHPVTYRPFFLGEFAENPTTGRAELVNNQDPMLYWLVPILPKRNAAPTGKIEDEIDDFLSTHAGFKIEWRRP